MISPRGGIGRHVRLKIWWRNSCWFKSGRGDQYINFYKRQLSIAVFLFQEYYIVTQLINIIKIYYVDNKKYIYLKFYKREIILIVLLLFLNDIWILLTMAYLSRFFLF